ncbi:TetR/AcrR family transcriptional regulator [Amycolatopsis minnesotensis]|uniref:TetR family transcriptional regulator n=1 Tax=Amycolatopsis minnesotensis TaxID=337894 RepID=A0ABP5BG71_9PSEU
MAEGLRERKKERTRQAISDTAIAMFLERGFDEVAVSDVAAAAEVSKPTVFRYFPAKEDLVLHRFADHRGETARVVRARETGATPLAAVRRHFLDGLDRRDPVTGLCDSADVLAFHRLVFTTPAVTARLAELETSNLDELADVLREAAGDRDGSPRPRLVAAQILAVHQVLARENWRRLTTGGTADDTCAQAVADAETAFALLARGAAEDGY